MFYKCKKYFIKNKRDDKIIDSDKIFNKVEKSNIIISKEIKDNLNNNALTKKNKKSEEKSVKTSNHLGDLNTIISQQNQQLKLRKNNIYLPDKQQCKNTSSFKYTDKVWTDYYLKLYEDNHKNDKLISIKDFL